MREDLFSVADDLFLVTDDMFLVKDDIGERRFVLGG